MDERDLERELAAMGIPRSSARVIALLPLVEVAWADGTIQDSEQAIIMGAARDRYGLDATGLALLKAWLRERPSPRLVEQGRHVLSRICGEASAAGLDVSCTDVISLSREVATAAGGFFGFGAIEASEAKVIDDIAQALDIATDRTWVLPEDPTHVPDDADAESEGPSVRVTFHRLVGKRDGATLVHYDPDRGDQVCHIGELPVSIGRADDNAIQIEFDAQVSRHHCEVRAESGGFVVQDLNSVSGTWVDGVRIAEHRLVDGQTLHIGSTTLFFQDA